MEIEMKLKFPYKVSTGDMVEKYNHWIIARFCYKTYYWRVQYVSFVSYACGFLQFFVTIVYRNPLSCGILWCFHGIVMIFQWYFHGFYGIFMVVFGILMVF